MLIEVIELDGDDKDLTREELDRFVEAFPILVIQ